MIKGMENDFTNRKIEKSMFPMFPMSRQNQCYGNQKTNQQKNAYFRNFNFHKLH
jgi:hypothetical protein